LDARVEVDTGAGAAQQHIVSKGRAAFTFSVATPSAVLRVYSAEHQVLHTKLGTDSTDLQLWLDPLDARPAPPTARSTVYGYVYDPWRAQPVAGAVVQLGELRVRSDTQGYFEIARASTTDRDTHEQLNVTAPGLPAWQQMLRLSSGETGLIIDLGAGAPGADHHFDDGNTLQLSAAPATTAGSAPRAPILTPPTSVRVGFADAGFTTPCCVGSCNAVSVMSLETYVRRGLNDEWIASWTGDSLRAGAIAYRSYGAWHVDNPRTSSYDICSSACCQVNDADTHSATSAAVDATAGILLIGSNGLFRSEYSAENNAWDDPNDGLSCSNADLVCGDGFVGSPSTGWPCLGDVVALGRGCFGHGRGMSQWGSQRWALNEGRRWPWIVDHYYNDNQNSSGAGTGLRTAVLSSPLRIDQLSVPNSAQPGQSIVLELDVHNLAAQAHDPVWIGASLFRSGIGFISDPAGDSAVRLEPGQQLRSRTFQLPAGISSGSYDVLVALYLDIDGNAAINSGDLALTNLRMNAVLSIEDGSLLVDGFE
jgi:hypothetical protein